MQNRPIRHQARVAADPERRAGGQCKQVRQHITHHIDTVDGKGRVFDPDVHVHAENKHALRHLAQIVDQALIPAVRRHAGLLPRGEWVGSRRRRQHAHAAGQCAHLPALMSQRNARFTHGPARRLRQLDHGCREFVAQRSLGLAPAQHRSLCYGSTRENVAEIACLRIDDLIFLFDTDPQNSVFGSWMPPKLPPPWSAPSCHRRQ